ncbi:hypothetical protein H2200_003818 [Cladophialophora chaetospira]|uniref:Uncharacterized protein n=1 Tax=Cladophialophora chaetospira TaxID=386627 RepID=A0AA38XF59_9EURO|nr:hypothetical protein H2200_003818 [Cladophialophora chaetospira]
MSGEDAGFLKKTSEAVANAGASVAGAVSGSLSLGANASSKKTTTTKTKIPADQHQQILTQGGARQPAQGRIADGGSVQQKRLTQQDADSQYSERIEEEYAKREGGA